MNKIQKKTFQDKIMIMIFNRAIELNLMGRIFLGNFHPLKFFSLLRIHFQKMSQNHSILRFPTEKARFTNIFDDEQSKLNKNWSILHKLGKHTTRTQKKVVKVMSSLEICIFKIKLEKWRIYMCKKYCILRI